MSRTLQSMKYKTVFCETCMRNSDLLEAVGANSGLSLPDSPALHDLEPLPPGFNWALCNGKLNKVVPYKGGIAHVAMEGLSPDDSESLKKMLNELSDFCGKHRIPMFCLVQVGVDKHGCASYSSAENRPGPLNFDFGETLESAAAHFVQKCPVIYWPDGRVAGRRFTAVDAMKLACAVKEETDYLGLTQEDILTARKYVINLMGVAKYEREALLRRSMEGLTEKTEQKDELQVFDTGRVPIKR